MKYFSFLFLIFLISSCTPSDDGVEITQSMLEGKWLIENSTEYLSVEFNKSNTCLIQKIIDGDSAIVYDNYIFDSGEVILEKEGRMSDININGNSISFTITNNGNQHNLSGNATTFVVVDSDVNDLFARTWNLELANGQKIDSLENGLHVFFSMNGTYYGHPLSDDKESEQRFWNWSNPEDNLFCYSISPIMNCELDSKIGEVISVTEDTLTIFQFDIGVTFKLSVVD